MTTPQPHDTARFGRTAALLTRGMDAATDLALLSFAVWTLLYHLGLWLRPPTAVLVGGWAAATAAIAAGMVLRGRRPAEDTGPAQDAGPGAPRWAAWAGPCLGVAAGLAAGFHSAGVPWWVTCGLAVAAVAVTGYALRGAGAGPFTSPGPAGRGSFLVLGTALGFAVGSLFIVNTDADDAYFVSRSVWTAENGRIPLRDVIFSQGTYAPISGEPPVASFEVFVGALARPLGIPASSFLWYVVLPAVVFLAVWALWRLVREWAPRRAALCFALGAVYLLWSGAHNASLGSFHLVRLWQGKAVLVSLVIPLLYVYLTRWAERRSGTALALAAAAGVAATGLTSSAAFVVPLITAAVAGPLLLTGRVRDAVAACAASAYPIAAGLVVMLGYSAIEVAGSFHPAPRTYSWIMMTGILGALGGAALWGAPRLARAGTPAMITAGVAGVTTVLIIPGVLELVRDASGAGPVLWRTLWLVPAPALVGLLAAIRLPAVPRLSWTPPALVPALAPGLAAGALIPLVGTPVWAEENGSTVAARPAWKADPGRLRAARTVVAASGERGVVLMPLVYMRYVPVITTRVNAVSPNNHYLRLMPAPPEFTEDRLLLTQMVRSKYAPMPTPQRAADALRRIGVTVACARADNLPALELLRSAGYGNMMHVSRLRCLFPGRAPGSPAGS
ncbi:hypothetical protein DPM19_32000 [Actinomadura craniellae]|uniref:Glycosyltransferase RgtA/B/C/D-like domain-containing protein n=1 Tax=Actinomadura craniellae TaxID=2231787 RepID=A0A365GWD7_9ACTN|nr:DUF6077 domain-containing protein [Actinomadura craniellae]RAY11130.1 hypothetical protein DPM19_32000 [Actinomadura craniellae]